jgi:hypothetical protein
MDDPNRVRETSQCCNATLPLYSAIPAQVNGFVQRNITFWASTIAMRHNLLAVPSNNLKSGQRLNG